MSKSKVTQEEVDIFVGAVNFMQAMGLALRRSDAEAQETEEAHAEPTPEPTPEPIPEPPKIKYCTCVKNPHYQTPPEVPLEIHSEVQVRCGRRGSRWLNGTVVKIHRMSEDSSKWLYDIQYENERGKTRVGHKLRRCLIQLVSEPRRKSDRKLFCTACGLPPSNTKGFESFKAGKGDVTFWAKPEVLYGSSFT